MLSDPYQDPSVEYIPEYGDSIRVKSNHSQFGGMFGTVVSVDGDQAQVELDDLGLIHTFDASELSFIEDFEL